MSRTNRTSTRAMGRGNMLRTVGRLEKEIEEIISAAPEQQPFGWEDDAREAFEEAFDKLRRMW